MCGGYSRKVCVDPNALPKFFRPRVVPFALRGRVEKELDRLQSQGVIEPVRFAEWAAPIVPNVKGDGSVRICGDYKVTANAFALVDTYPLPRIDDLLASLSGGKSFTKLDLAHAYLQIPLEERSKKYTTINTQRGLFQYNRLPFGLSAAPAIFQRTMESILRGLPRVCIYLDDILITGVNEEDHLHNLKAVLSRLKQAGFRLKRHKCAFLLPSIEYLGHVIDAEGLRPSGKKTQAIQNAPTPKTTSELRSFLGLMNYYGKFIPNLSTLMASLHWLLQKHVKWDWGRAQENAFRKAKGVLSSSQILVHFQPDKDLVVICDASPYGVGAVLSHVLDGTERPIYYASRSLAIAEKKYSQLDKEGLAIIFAVKRFHQFLYGRPFLIKSDHKPLQYIFGHTHPVPPLASARLQRWALILGAYDYKIVYRPGGEIGNADGLSRLPLPNYPTDIPVPGETILLMRSLELSEITAERISQWTSRNPLLSRIRRFLHLGWPHLTDEETTFPSQKG